MKNPYIRFYMSKGKISKGQSNMTYCNAHFQQKNKSKKKYFIIFTCMHTVMVILLNIMVSVVRFMRICGFLLNYMLISKKFMNFLHYHHVYLQQYA